MIHTGAESLGIRGKIIKLNRANGEYVRVPFMIFNVAGVRYAVFWYKPTDATLEVLLAHSSGHANSGDGSTGSGYNDYRLYKDTDYSLKLEYEHSNGVVNTITIGTLISSEPNLICIGSDDRITARGSLNGAAFVSTATATSANNPPSSNRYSFMGGDAARVGSGDNAQTTVPTTSFCEALFDDFGIFNLQPTTAQLLDLYKGGKGKKLNRSSLYGSNGISYVTFDELNVVDRKGSMNYRFFANIYHVEYDDMTQAYFDGVNDYAVGVHGTNGFSISDFIVSGDFMLNAIVNFDTPVNGQDVGTRLFMIRNTSSTVGYIIGMGNQTSGVANEIIEINKNFDPDFWRAYSDATAELSGWHMVTITQTSTNGFRIYIDGTRVDNVTSTTNPTSTTLTGCTQIYLASSLGTGQYANVSYRQMSYWKGRTFADADVTTLWNFYTTTGTVPIGDSTVDMATDTGYFSDAALKELWKGDVSSGELVASVKTKAGFPSAHHNLVINNRILTPTSSTNFLRRRGKEFLSTL
jgi:hypothetical protein